MKAFLLNQYFILFVSYLISLGAGWFLVDWWMKALTNRSEVLKKDKDGRKRDVYLVRILGLLERLIYTTCIVYGKPEGIAAWLAIKVITRWTNEREKEGWETISKSNLYLIGNLLNVFVGVVVGLIYLTVKMQLK
jgi:hypothetical protein